MTEDAQKKTALVVSGAGARIIVEAGMLKAWHESGLKYDYLLGTSSGALAAAFFHAGQINDLLELCLTIKNDDVYAVDFTKAWTHEACFFNNAHLKRSIQRHLNFAALRANKIDCIVNVTDINSWQTKQYVLNELSDDDIVSALMYSTAVPVAFPQHDGLVDGGIMDDFPVFDALADHVDRIVLIVASTPEPRAINNVADMIDVTISMLLYNQLATAKRAIKLFNPGVEFIVVEPEKPTGIPILGFSDLGSREKRTGYIAWGYQLGMAQLKGLK